MLLGYAYLVLRYSSGLNITTSVDEHSFELKDKQILVITVV